MAKYLDNAGVQVLWDKIKAEDAKKLDLSGGTLTGALTLSGAPTENLHAATKKYVDDSIVNAGAGDMHTTIYDTNGNGIVDNAEKVNGHTVETDVPAGAKFTDTVFTLEAATADALGGVKVGAGINVALDGTISVDTATTTAIQGEVDTLKATVGNAGSGLVKDVADNKTAIQTAQGAADSAQADVDALEAKVGTVPASKTVVEMINDAKTEATYDDTALKGRVAVNENAIATLNGNGVGSVSKAVADGIAGIIANAPEDFD